MSKGLQHINEDKRGAIARRRVQGNSKGLGYWAAFGYLLRHPNVLNTSVLYGIGRSKRSAQATVQTGKSERPRKVFTHVNPPRIVHS
jgi:hypothetical protein